MLATYRLLPTARYPQGAEDVALALAWAKANIERYGGSPSCIFAMGQSAGAANLAISMFTDIMEKVGVVLRGAVLMGTPFEYDLSIPRRRESMLQYHSTKYEDEVFKYTANGNFVAATKEALAQRLPPAVLVSLGEYDPEEIAGANMSFVNAFKRKMRKMPLLEVWGGHNHISYVYGIGLQDDEAGKRLLRFVRENSGK